MIDWNDLVDQPEKLAEYCNKSSASQVARDYGLSDHKAVTYHLHKHGYENINGMWQEPEPAGVKQGEEERKADKIDCGDYWIVTSGERELKISKEKYSNIRKDYCDETSNHYLNISSITRKYNMPRKDFMLLKSAFNFVHNDVRYTDEEMMNSDVEELVDKTLEEKKNQYIKKLQQEEVKSLRREVNKYRQQDYHIEKINDMVEQLFTELAATHERPTVPDLQSIESDVMLEIPIADLHLARLCWEAEVGENYDRHIAEDKFKYIIREVLSRTEGYEFEKILFPVGNDFLNTDGIDSETTKGTRQDNDSRWQKMITTGERLLIEVIDILSQIAPVDVFWIPGNHDYQTSYHLTRTLQAWYRNNPNVEVDTSPKARKYREYGINLIGFTHGDKEKKRIFGDMQVEVPEKWGRTRYREWHAAHLHSEHVKEQNGIILRRLSSPAPKSAWEFGKGYQSISGSQAFVWHKEKGLIDINPVNFL